MAPAQKVTVELLPERRITIDGVQVGPGQTADVSAQDAKTLIDEGYAKKASRPKSS